MEFENIKKIIIINEKSFLSPDFQRLHGVSNNKTTESTTGYLHNKNSISISIAFKTISTHWFSIKLSIKIFLTNRNDQ